MSEKAESKEASAKITRQRSKEAQLKLDKRGIERELKLVAKRVEEFESMKKDIAGAEQKKEQLAGQLTTIKTALIKELGLS